MPFDCRHRLANAARLVMVVGAVTAADVVESAGSHRLSVGATVVHGGSCSFTSPGALSFKAESKAAVDIPYRCNGGAAATVSWAVAANSAPSGHYSLHAPAPSARAGNAGHAVTLTGTVTTADLQRSDSYGDTV